MPHTLLMRLAGSMQSYGTPAAGMRYRDTEIYPTKSACIGMLCSAMGKPAHEKESDGFIKLKTLASMRFAVRIDRPGILMADFHTTMDVPTADTGGSKTVVSRRFYLSGASFLTGFESEDEGLLRMLSEALWHPCWLVSLGRRGCLPSEPLRLFDGGIRPVAVGNALRQEPWHGDQNCKVLIVEECSVTDEGADVVMDVPTDFHTRTLATRCVRYSWSSPPRR